MNPYERRRALGAGAMVAGGAVVVEGAAITLDALHVVDDRGRQLLIEHGESFANLVIGAPHIAVGALAMVYGSKLFRNLVR